MDRGWLVGGEFGGVGFYLIFARRRRLGGIWVGGKIWFFSVQREQMVPYGLHYLVYL